MLRDDTINTGAHRANRMHRSAGDPPEPTGYPRIAVFTPYRIWPPDNGGRALVSAGCIFTTRAGVPLRCFALRTLREGPVPPPEEFDYVERRSGLSALNALDRLRLSKVPFLASLRLYARRMARWALDFRADIVEVHMPWLMGIRQWLPRSIPVVLHAQNVENDWYRPVLAEARFSSLCAAWLRRIEGAAIRAADRIMTLTPRDAAELSRLYGVPPDRFVHEAPGVVTRPPINRATREGPGPLRKRAAFCGSRFSDNIAAARRLIERVAPAVGAEWDIEIAGTVCGELGTLPRPSNVRLLGYIEDLNSWMSGCDVFLNPVDMKTGINMKMLSALENRLPVITTPDGARGFDAFIGHALRTVPLESFAEALRSPPQWSAADEARLSELGWPAVIERRLALYRAWISEARAQSAHRDRTA